MFHSRKKSSNINNNPSSKEFQELEKSNNSNRKLSLNKYLDKLQQLTIMLLSIYVNTSHNIFQKNKLNTLPKREKLKSTNTFQLKDKLSTIPRLNFKLQALIFTLSVELLMQEDNMLQQQQLTMFLKLSEKLLLILQDLLM
jgi:hypothetical protein